jgi:hypothetical protein
MLTQTRPVLSIPPQSILHDPTCDLNGLGEPEHAHNYNKVNACTESGGQHDSREARIIGESRCLQPPAGSRGADCADQLGAYGADHECGANAYRAARITNLGYGKEQARDDDRDGDPCGAKRQTSENRHDLDNERNDSPVSPAVRSPDGKVQPAL